MKIEIRAVAALALCVSPLLLAADPDKPGGKRICVPSEDGRSWVCGTADSPPPERGLPTTRNDGPSPEPPAFLMDPAAGNSSAPAVDLSAPEPERPPPDRFEGSGRELPTTGDMGAPAPIAEETPAPAEPLVEAAPAVEPEPAPVESARAEDTYQSLDVVGADSAEAGTPAFIAAPSDSDYPYAGSTQESAPAEAAAPESSAEATIAGDAPAAGATEAPPVATEVVEPVAAEPVAAEPVAAEPVAAEPVAVEPIAVEPVASEPEPVASAPEPATAPEPEPAPVIVAPVVATPAAAEPAPEPYEESATAAAAEPQPATAQALSAPAGNSSAFLALAATHYTLQLARAASQSGFSAQLATLGLRGEAAWAVPLSGGGSTSWLLLWGDFPDLDAARAAAAQLAPRHAAWPRRIAPIQAELRAIGTR